MADKPVKTTKSIPVRVAIVDREQITICGDGVAQKIVVAYPADSVRDLEVVSQPALIEAIKESLTTHKITSGRLIMILAPNIYYEKELSKVSESERLEEGQAFLDTIPFLTVSSRQFRIGESIHLIAINRTFYEVIHTAFKESGLEVIAVTPYSAVPGFNPKVELGPEQCAVIAKRPENAVQNSFLMEENTDQDFSAKKEKFLKKHQIILGGFSFVAVAMALLTSMYTLQRPTPKRTASAAPVVAKAKPTATVIPTPTLVLITDPKEIKMKVANASGVPGLAQQAKTQLEKLGFSQIRLETASISSEPTQVAISPQVDKPMVINLEKWLTTNYPNYRQITLDPSNSADHAVIILGKK